MKYLCENIQGCVLGYTQSDEISLVLVDYAELTTDAWFGNNLQTERYYRLDETYQSTGSGRWGDYSSAEFGIQFVYDKFCDDTIEKYEQLNYGKHIGFTSKEECQKYCDWLNKQKK